MEEPDESHVFTQEFFIWFTWQGGSGTTLALAFLLLFARSKQLRLIGRAAAGQFS